MTRYIDKSALVAEIEKRRSKNAGNKLNLAASFEDNYLLSFLDTLEVKEVSEELAETYMQVFEKKFPILPTLKGKRLDKFKNFLNSCRQIFGLQEFGIRPVQAQLFEKLALLWSAWGAENLQGIGQVKGEPDVVKEVGFEKGSLTWEDIREIYIIFAEIDAEIEFCKTDIQGETIGYYQEALKRYKARKEEELKKLES